MALSASGFIFPAAWRPPLASTARRFRFGVNCSYASAMSLAKDAAAPAKNVFVIARLHGTHDDLTCAGRGVNEVALSQINADMIAEVAVVADCVKAHQIATG